MYVPQHFSSPAIETLVSLLPDASFATLVTVDDQGDPFASHIPVSFDAKAGEYGTITGHLAKANPHSGFIATRPSLVIFSGPHQYISPRDYDTKMNVPTWNYVAVHARGQAVIETERERVRAVLEGLTRENERDRRDPWDVGMFDEKRLNAMMNAIVAFNIPVAQLQAKAKLGQNKSEADRKALADATIGTELEAWQRSSAS
ncbi:FMN-binding negative transcriptional regulator [Sneathiella aquimaris]|uniref:FMN-binding negative transcriptional regulator n=1 Tax=Sneathiella aquimaris TaxID=2599305 RepID=UPI00146BDED7|nr:FMN-binding negative transcriptional regulator [Sneathiella aquimaris]